MLFVAALSWENLRSEENLILIICVEEVNIDDSALNLGVNEKIKLLIGPYSDQDDEAPCRFPG